MTIIIFMSVMVKVIMCARYLAQCLTHGEQLLDNTHIIIGLFIKKKSILYKSNSLRIL